MKKLLFLLFIPFISIGQITTYKISSLSSRPFDFDMGDYKNWNEWSDAPDGIKFEISISSKAVKCTVGTIDMICKFTEDISSTDWPTDKKGKIFGSGESEPSGNGEFYSEIPLQDLLAGKGAGKKVYFWVSLPNNKTMFCFRLE